MSSARLTITTPARDTHALALCRDALRAVRVGDCAAALGIITPLWEGVGREPKAQGLGLRAGAELYHCAGTITSVANQSAEAQTEARRLLKKAARGFRALGDGAQSVRSAHEIAASYLRSGLHRRAWRVARACLKFSKQVEAETEAGLLLVSAIADWCVGRPADSLATLEAAFPLFEAVADERTSGAFHNTLALSYQDDGIARADTDYLQRAFIEFTAAGFYFEQAGSVIHQSSVENNLGRLLSLLGRHTDAHPHLDRARSLALSIGDEVQAARVEVTRARVLCAAGQLADAESVIDGAVVELIRLGADYLLAEAQSVLADVRAQRAVLHPNVLHFGTPSRYVVTVSDDSLVNAGIEAGDDVWLCRASQARDGELVYASTPDGMMLAFYYSEGEDVSLIFANAECEPCRFPASAVRVRGIVAGR
jgi:tetratricopeptide (TPR) repeat protein